MELEPTQLTQLLKWLEDERRKDKVQIATLQERRDWHAELLGQLDAEEKQISVTDPDTRRMPMAQGNVVGYNAQMAGRQAP